MHNIITINLSPRKKGTSVVVLDMLKQKLEKQDCSVQIVHLYQHLKNMQLILDLLKSAHTIVFCGPCYTNTYPADTTLLLTTILEHPDVQQGQNVYGIIQGGMPYEHTHVSGLHMLRLFSNKVNMTYKGGFIIGMAAMLDGQPIRKHLRGKKLEKQLHLFFANVEKGLVSPDSVYRKSLFHPPGFLARIMAFMVNNSIKKEYASRGMNMKDPSPYQVNIPLL